MHALVSTRARKKISLTALIDVVFILLMFFMLTSSFSQWQAVDLAAPASAPAATVNEPQIIYLNPEGKFTLVNGDHVSAANLAVQFDLAQSVIIIPAPETALQTLVTGIEALKQSGFARVTLGKPSLPGAN